MLRCIMAKSLDLSHPGALAGPVAPLLRLT